MQRFLFLFLIGILQCVSSALKQNTNQIYLDPISNVKLHKIAQQYSGGETNFHHNQDSFLANNNFQDVAHGVFPHLHLSYESLNPQVYYYEYMGFRKPDAYNYQPGQLFFANGGNDLQKKTYASLRYCDEKFAKDRVNGVYEVVANGRKIRVYCEFKNGVQPRNWLVFQRRRNGNEKFFRNWTDYEQGFGKPSEEFWLGLLNLHELTKFGSYTLRVDLTDFNNQKAYAEYGLFSISSSSYMYSLLVDYYYGNAGDSLSYHNGLPFTTKDRDNDRHYHGRNCAEDDRGAWWYNSCQLSNLNGRYFAKPTTTHQGINWYTWKRSFYSMKEVTMKLAHNSL